MKKRIKLITVLIALLLHIHSNAQEIKPFLYGQNAWMPDTIGTKFFNGQLHKKWTEVQESGAKVIRFGGIAPDKDKPTNFQFIRMIDSIRNKGMEPVIQIPFYDYKYSVSEAADLVEFINIQQGKGIKYWSIGNEPDHVYGYTFAEEVADYYKSYSMAMKAVDPSIKIMGPETSWYIESILYPLTDPSDEHDLTGKDGAGNYYMDVVSFHTYPFDHRNKSRDAVIAYPTAPGKFRDRLIDLNNRIANCNTHHGRTGDNALKIGVTETNVVWQNAGNDDVYGVGANSFLGGQYWAEIMGVCMSQEVDFINFWSVIEGNRTANNIGYLDYVSGKKKPSYYHYQMLTEHFQGDYCAGTTNLHPEVIAFGSKNEQQIAVMLLNRHETSGFDFTLSLDSAAISTPATLTVNINASLEQKYHGTIDKQSSMLLVFDLSGNPVKKCEYQLFGHADADLPPSCTIISSNCDTPQASIFPSGSLLLCNEDSLELSGPAGNCYTYQWKKDGHNIIGAIHITYTATSDGSYTLEVISDGDTALSANSADLAIKNLQATITPSGTTTFCTEDSVILYANTGTDYSYQWVKDGSSIIDATDSAYIARNSGDYRVEIISDSCNSISDPVTVAETDSLSATISTSGSAIFCTGDSVVLYANTGNDYSYQWFKNDLIIAGATDSSYIAKTAGDYMVEITSGSCTGRSDPVTVDVNEDFQAEITTEGPASFCHGGVTLYANTGSGYAHQWFVNGLIISGETDSSYYAKQEGDYSVMISSGSCEAVSDPLTVTQTDNMVAEITPEGSTSICTGETVWLHANKGDNYSYQWRKDDKTIGGEKSASYQASATGSYGVKISQGKCKASSEEVSVNISGCSFKKDTGVIQNQKDSLSQRICVHAFPNPNMGSFTLEITGALKEEIVNYQLISAKGQVIKKGELIMTSSYFGTSIALENAFSSGVYILQINIGESYNKQLNIQFIK